MRFINRVLNPFHSQEDKLKKARDAEIKKRRAEGLSDEQIIGCLMAMPETEEFIVFAVKHRPVPGKDLFVRCQMSIALKEGFTKVVKK